MRRLTPIWIPLLVLAGFLSAGWIHAGSPASATRSGSAALRLCGFPDSVSPGPDSLRTAQDSLRTGSDSLTADLPAADSLGIGRDSLPVPGTPAAAANSLNAAADPAQSAADTTAAAPADSTAAGDSLRVLSPRELRKMRRDSIRHVKDSIRQATPRVLETYIVPDSLKYKRILYWNSDPATNAMHFVRPDTTFNDWYTEIPFLKEDVNASYLGLAGSAALPYNYFKRKEIREFQAYSPFLPYFRRNDEITLYNTKTPYTELGYWGTLFAYKEKEESSVRFLHTQNITPAWNIAVLYKQFGAKGLLNREATDNRGLEVTTNYLGKRYVMNAGYIRDKITRTENGGICNSSDIRDTVLDAKTIKTYLNNASSKTVRNSLFLNHSYGIPLTFRNDSLEVGEGTMAFIGHSAEISSYSRFYKDQIALSDETGRAFYHNRFYINPTQSADSIRTFLVENRAFIRLQPWTDDAIVSKLDGGVGHQYISYYGFNPQQFLAGNSNTSVNNLYVYAGASGRFRKYFAWEGYGRYNFAGYNLHDFEINASATFAFYPFLDREAPVLLNARFGTELYRPDWFSEHYYSNHYVWDNDFAKISRTRAQAELSVPRWKLSADFGYALVGNHVYYDTTGMVRQQGDLLNVLTASIRKEFKIWHFHLDNRILAQYSSDQDILPLPLLALNLRYYFQYELVKDVLTVQLGADATFNTEYYAPAYNPALGIFQTQQREKFGNNPYIDVFLNMQWKQVSVFLKVVNIAQGWPNGDYFASYGYIRPQRAFKFGIHWPFYFK